MKRLKSTLGIAFIATCSSNVFATGIPCVDALNVAANMKQIVLEQVGQAKQLLTEQAQMALEQKLTEYTGLTFSNATAEATARVTDAMAGVHNKVAEVVNLPPITSCVMYNESKNTQKASADASTIKDYQTERFADWNINVGDNAKPPAAKLEEMRTPIFGRVKSNLSTNKDLLQIDASNFLRTGKYADKDITDSEAIARQDMLDMLSEVKVNQRFDYRKDPSDFNENDISPVMDHMKVLARAAIARGAMAEVYSLSAQGEGGVSVNQMISSFNKSRYLNPDWVMNTNNTSPGQELVQPEQVEREIVNIDSYKAYLAEKSYVLQQWQAMIQATMLVMEIEEK